MFNVTMVRDSREDGFHTGSINRFRDLPRSIQDLCQTVQDKKEESSMKNDR